MEKEKKPTERKCVGCAQMKDKRNLIRVVRTPDGNIVIDPTGKLNGRGAYICKTSECFEKCRKSKRFDKSFGVSVPDEIYNSLKEAVENL